MDLFDRNWATGEDAFRLPDPNRAYQQPDTFKAPRPIYQPEPISPKSPHETPSSRDIEEVQRILNDMAKPKAPDPPKDPPKAPDRTEEFHEQNFSDQQLEDLRKEMAERNKQFEEPQTPSTSTSGLGAPVPPVSSAYGWIAAGTAATMTVGALATLGYTASQIDQIQSAVAKAPPGTSVPLPPPAGIDPRPGEAPVASPIYARYGVDPRLLFLNVKKKGRKLIKGLV